MFEREADLAETEMLIHCHGDYSKKKNYREGWQDGAEFGYNKANEWHYVKDGDLPKEEGEYLVCYETEKRTYRTTFILNYTEYDESLHWCDEAFETYDEGVIAWCEIPKYTDKEIKEND